MTPIKVTYFSSPKSNVAITVLLDIVMGDFKQGKYASQISKIREVLNDKGVEAYKDAKKSLPAIAFCGEFKGGHAKNNLVQYNNLLVFDIDHLTEKEMESVRHHLATEDIVMAFWVSPSGYGYKGLLKVEFQNVPEIADLNDCYKKAFSDAMAFFMQKHNIQFDSACSDFSRICYVCWDENLFFRENSKILFVDCEGLNSHAKTIPLSKKTGGEKQCTKATKVFKPLNVKGKNNQRSRKIVSSIIKYLLKRNLSITATYDEWLRVGFAIANTFNYDLGLKYYLELCKLDKERYNEAKCIEKLQECYTNGSGDITIGTIIEMAKKKGYINKGSSEDS